MLYLLTRVLCFSQILGLCAENSHPPWGFCWPNHAMCHLYLIINCIELLCELSILLFNVTSQNLVGVLFSRFIPYICFSFLMEIFCWSAGRVRVRTDEREQGKMLVHFSILSNPITLVKDLEQNLPSWSSYWIIIECGAIVGTSRPHPMVKTATASAAGLRTLYNFFRGENPNSCSLILGQMHHAIQGHLLL